MAGKNSEDNLLTRKGCKNTKSRKAVIDVLQNAKMPISVEEIYLAIKNEGISTNLSTVYRILDLMESMKLVNKIVVDDGKARYELTGDGHRHHLICTNCRKMIPIDTCPLKSLEKDVGEKTNFDITGHRLEIYGVCPECKKD